MEMAAIAFIQFLFWIAITGVVNCSYYFPDDFQFGVATSAYQIEGAWNESGKGESIWDRLVHENPHLVKNGANGDVACDSYHKYEEDVKLLEDLRVDFYRFSLSWSRIFPSGYATKINSAGIEHYNKFLDVLVSKNISAMVTLFHWDLPQSLMNMGGFTNPDSVKWLTEYAKVAFEHFGDRVKLWTTFNEPYQICMEGYGNVNFAPVLNMSGVADYLCTHNLLKAHAAMYHLYNDTYKPKFKGKIGITVSAQWVEPSPGTDEFLAERLRLFMFGIHLHPIFSNEGDYPSMVIERVRNRSSLEGYPKSRLPKFTAEEVKYIRGTSDFLGFNHYTTYSIREKEEDFETSYWNDCGATVGYEDDWQFDSADFFAIVPWGFRKVLNWLKDNCNDPEIIVTESGCADRGEIDDFVRIYYYGKYLQSLLEAIHVDKVRVVGYSSWSLMDSFEWLTGYTTPMGLYSVNFSDPNRTRIPKSSSRFYKNIIGNRTVIPYDNIT